MYKKIMVPLDGSVLAECVLPHAELAARCYSSSEVIFIQAVEPITIPYGREVSEVTSVERLKELETHNKEDAEKYLKAIVARFKNAGINARSEVVFGKAAEALAGFAAKNNVDLLVIATHGRSGVKHLIWGSVAERLLRSVCAPILMIRAPGCYPGA